MENFSVTILGSSSASPTSQRHTSAQLLNFYQRMYLIDCGESTQIQLRRNHLKLSKINHVLISHLHGDHFFGLVGFISSLNLFGRKKELHIYSDPRIQQIIDLQMEISESQLQFKIIYHPLNFHEKELIFEDKKLEIYSFPLEHRIPTCGFLFQEKPGLPNIKKSAIQKYEIGIEERKSIRQGSDFVTTDGQLIRNQELTRAPAETRSYAYCSDTKYTPYLKDYFQGVELLYTECTFMNDFQQIAEDKFHMTTGDAAKLAKEVNTKKLLAGHFSARYKDLSEMNSELKSLFEKSELVYENKTYHVREE